MDSSRRTRLFLPVLIALAGVSCSGPPAEPSDADGTVPVSSSPDITADDLARHIATLASDDFQGRAPGTPGGEKTVEYIAGEYERIGLEPAFDDGYLQQVPLVEITLDEDGSAFAIGPEDDMEPLATGDDVVFWTKRVVEEVGFEDTSVVFVGYGSVAPEYGWDDYAGVDVGGKTVVMLVNDPGYATQDPDLFNGNAMTYYGRWTYKYEEAGRQGAAAAIIIHETDPASYGWDTVRNSWTGPQIDLDRSGGAAPRAAAEGWITDEVAERLFQAAGLDFEELKAAAARPGFVAVPMDGIKASATLVNSIRRTTSPNVVGLLPGASRPDEFVLYNAHWDHLGVSNDPDLDDRIFNGAVDNGTGVAAILEIAETMASSDPRPDRSVLFAAVTAEESGLLGSAYLATNPPVRPGRIAGGINIDSILPAGRSRDVVVIGYGASELEEYLADAAADQGRVVAPDPMPEAGYFYRSDHVNFAKEGVPMLYAEGGKDLLDGGVEAGERFAAEYVQNRYHQPGDEYDAGWNMAGLVEEAMLAYRVGDRLARSADWPNWYPGNEFRAIRDASRADE